MTDPIVHQYAEEAARRHGTTAAAIFSRNRDAAVISARWQLWRWLAADGWTPSKIAQATGHDRTSVMNALDKLGVPWPRPERGEGGNSEARAAVQAAAAAMLAKHEREVASRY